MKVRWPLLVNLVRFLQQQIHRFAERQLDRYFYRYLDCFQRHYFEVRDLFFVGRSRLVQSCYLSLDLESCFPVSHCLVTHLRCLGFGHHYFQGCCLKCLESQNRHHRPVAAVLAALGLLKQSLYF